MHTSVVALSHIASQYMDVECIQHPSIIVIVAVVAKKYWDEELTECLE